MPAHALSRTGPLLHKREWSIEPPPAPMVIMMTELSASCRYPWMNAGDLHEALTNERLALTEHEWVKICVDVAEALMFWFVSLLLLLVAAAPFAIVRVEDRHPLRGCSLSCTGAAIVLAMQSRRVRRPGSWRIATPGREARKHSFEYSGKGFGPRLMQAIHAYICPPHTPTHMHPHIRPLLYRTTP